jgi:hypothetical protein
MERKKKPGGLVAVCVIAMVLGGLLTCTGLFTSVGLVTSQFLSNGQQGLFDGAAEQGKGSDKEALESVQQMQERMRSQQRKWFVPQLAIATIHLLLAVSLVVGGAMGMGLMPAGRSLILTACSIGIGFELLRTAFEIFVQSQSMEAMRDSMQEMAQSGSGAEVPMDQFMNLGMGFSIAMAACFAVVKLGYYIPAIVYLRRPHVRSLFTAGPSAAAGSSGPQPPSDPPPAA